MKVSFLDGPSLANKLPQLMNASMHLDIAMAYVKVGGLRILLKNMKPFLKKGASLRIVFGLSSMQGITDKEAAISLLKLSKETNVDVRKFNNSGFHPKLLIFNGDDPCIVVGSSNLTEAAQSTNAEANILVENADPDLLRDTLAFFKHYFNPAPKLKQEHVDSYNPQKPHGRKKSAGRTKEDILPSPPLRQHELKGMLPKKIWKIAPGRDAEYWTEWVNEIDDDGEGIVAMGWDIGDLGKIKSYDLLRDIVRRKAKSDWDKYDGKTKIKYVTDQLWEFKNIIANGNVFIVYSESRVLGVAEVTSASKYQYKGNKSITYEHQISVKYRWHKYWPKRADDKIVGILGKQGTLLPINEAWFWSYLIKTLP